VNKTKLISKSGILSYALFLIYIFFTYSSKAHGPSPNYIFIWIHLSVIALIVLAILWIYLLVFIAFLFKLKKIKEKDKKNLIALLKVLPYRVVLVIIYWSLPIIGYLYNEYSLSYLGFSKWIPFLWPFIYYIGEKYVDSKEEKIRHLFIKNNHPIGEFSTLWGFLIILTFSVIVLFVIIFHYQFIIDNKNISEENEEQTEYEFTDWNIYKNEKHGFEFKYPENWTILEYGDVIVLNSDSFGKIVIFISSGSPPETMNMELIEKTSIVIDGYHVSRNLFQGKFEDNRDSRYLRVFIPEKNIFYHMDFNKNDSVEIVNMYDKILFTFRFMD